MWKIFLLILALQSCSTSDKSTKKDSSILYSFQDLSGRYFLKKELKFFGKMMVTRTRLYAINQPHKEVEKFYTISKKRDSKSKIIEPVHSKIQVWLNKKENNSVISIDPKSKKLVVTYEKNKQLKKEKLDFPLNKISCFYSQVIECLRFNNRLHLARTQQVDIFVIWDGFPFYQDMYEGLDNKIYSQAVLSLVEKQKNGYKFLLSLDNGQSIVYFLDKNFEVDRMFWVAQGISLIRQKRG